MNCQGPYSVLIQIHKGCLAPYFNGVKSPTYKREDETTGQENSPPSFIASTH
jgi:hypothetical protein